MKKLIGDGRFPVAENDNQCMNKAAKMNSVETVRLLLQDSRIVPSENNVRECFENLRWSDTKENLRVLLGEKILFLRADFFNTK